MKGLHLLPRWNVPLLLPFKKPLLLFCAPLNPSGQLLQYVLEFWKPSNSKRTVPWPGPRWWHRAQPCPHWFSLRVMAQGHDERSQLQEVPPTSFLPDLLGQGLCQTKELLPFSVVVFAVPMQFKDCLKKKLQRGKKPVQMIEGGKTGEMESTEEVFIFPRRLAIYFGVFQTGCQTLWSTHFKITSFFFVCFLF